MPYRKFPKPRYKLKNMARFFAVLLVFLLVVTAFVVVLGKINDNKGLKTAVVVTPEATPTPTPEPTPPPIQIPDGKIMEEAIVVIDAGHGGRDPGTISPYQDDFYEKDVTLDIARKVRDDLVESGVHVIMTRDGEDHLNDVIKQDLIARAQVANDNHAALFVSIHVNAYDMKYKGAAAVNGMEVYYLDKPVMYDTLTPERLAGILADEISKSSGITLNWIRKNDYSVLRNTAMPAVLIETAYITNKEDYKRLASDAFREDTAKGIAEGIRKSLEEAGAFEYNGYQYVFKEDGE